MKIQTCRMNSFLVALVLLVFQETKIEAAALVGTTAGDAEVPTVIVLPVTTTSEPFLKTTTCPEDRDTCFNEDYPDRHDCYRVPVKNGCPVCFCGDPKPCGNRHCQAGEECVTLTDFCDERIMSCTPQFICISVNRFSVEATSKTSCPKLNCKHGCKPDIFSPGCPKCVCPQKCKDKRCFKHEKCILQEVRCFRAPCFPIPTCVRKKECPEQPPCGIMCPYGLQQDNNGCQLCKCRIL